MRHVAITPIELLLVDDNEDDVILFQEAMKEARLLHALHVAHDGKQALAFLNREPPHQDARRPDLILLDINMPRQNGFDTLDAIKRDPELKCLPIVMLTVSDREEDIARCYSMGACSYVKKPLDFDKLVTIVKELELYWTAVSRLPVG